MIDATEETTSSEDICRVTECYDLNREMYDRFSGGTSEAPWEEMDGQVPIIPFNQYAIGVRIMGATITDEPYFFSENGPDLRVLDPDYYEEHIKMMVEFEGKYGLRSESQRDNMARAA